MNGGGEIERSPQLDEYLPTDDALVDRARQAILEYVSPGLIVDLGTPSSTLGSALVEAGYNYVGISDRPESPRELERLGLRAVYSDLTDLRQLGDILDSLGQIGAFCVVTALDRLAAPDRLLTFLSAYATAHSVPRLIVTVPNLGHHEIGLRLLSGQLPVELGSVEHTECRQWFTGRALSTFVEQNGWRLVARHDLANEQTGQQDAPSLLLSPTLVGDFLHYVSRTFNPDAHISRFIWVLTPRPAATPATDTGNGSVPLVSILVRTQGERNELLTEALYSVYAQTCDDYEIIVCFHRPDDTTGDLQRAVEQTIASVPGDLLAKIRVIEARGNGRGAPLNALLEHARGRYVSFLDDDDLLFEHHVETLKQGVEEHGDLVLFQTFAAQRLLDPVPFADASPGDTTSSSIDRCQYPYTVVAMSVPWDQPLDPIRQHYENMVPICCLAVPLQLVRQTTLRFRTDIEVGEEWAFWMEALQILRVVVLPEVTAAVNHWNNRVTNAMRRPEVAPLWRQVRDTRHNEAAGVPLLLDGPVRRRLSASGQQLEELARMREVVANRETRLRSIYASRIWRTAKVVWWARRSLERTRQRLGTLLTRAE